MAENYRVRFLYNNFAELISQSIEKSSELAAFPFSNVINRFRSKLWIPSGAFIIDSTNNSVYIDDGSPKTVTLTSATYATPALFATHVQTQLNASSSGWTVTYDTAGETYKFTISNSGSVTLRLSQSTNAAWTTLGYIRASDEIGTSFAADDQRNHYPYEYATFDMGYNATISFFALIGPLDEAFSITKAATVTLKANNLNQDWDSPPLSITLSTTNGGIFRHLTDQSDTTYRYWRIEIDDMRNPAGPNALRFGNIYLGDELTFTGVGNNIARGFTSQIIDPSTTEQSENGTLYFNKKTKYVSYSEMQIKFLDKSVKADLEEMFNVVGITTPFYISIDPLLNISETIDEFTRYITFNDSPVFKHVFDEIYTVNFSMREML